MPEKKVQFLAYPTNKFQRTIVPKALKVLIPLKKILENLKKSIIILYLIPIKIWFLGKIMALY